MTQNKLHDFVARLTVPLPDIHQNACDWLIFQLLIRGKSQPDYGFTRVAELKCK